MSTTYPRGILTVLFSKSNAKSLLAMKILVRQLMTTVTKHSVTGRINLTKA